MPKYPSISTEFYSFLYSRGFLCRCASIRMMIISRCSGITDVVINGNPLPAALQCSPRRQKVDKYSGKEEYAAHPDACPLVRVVPGRYESCCQCTHAQETYQR